MKAHIRSAASPVALLAGIAPGSPAEATARAALGQLSIPVHTLADSAWEETIGALTDAALTHTGTALPTGSAADSKAPEAAEPLLLMANFPDALLNNTLRALREAGAPPMLKAIVTKHNKAWTVRALLAELQQERAAVQAQEGASHDL